jgi:hypothetical protein
MRPNLHRYSVKDLLAHAVVMVTRVDGKTIRTIKALLLQPGRLAADYMRGVRKPYLNPLQLFVLLNVVYFLSETVTHWAVFATQHWIHTNAMIYSDLARRLTEAYVSTHGTTVEALAPRFDASARVLGKSLVILMVPLFAVACAVVGPWGRRVVERLVFALHSLAFVLALFLVMMPLMNGVVAAMTAVNGVRPHWQIVDQLGYRINLFLVTLYFSLSLRTLSSGGWLAALVRGLLLAYAFSWILVAYRFLLFLITLYTLKP